MAIAKCENKNTDFLMISAWLCRFNKEDQDGELVY